MGISNQTLTIVDASGTTTVVTAGSTAPASGTMMLGSDGTNSQFLATDTSGRLVTANVGTTGSVVPVQANLIGASDGTNLVALRVKGASTAATTADPSLVVALSPNSPAKVWDGTNTVAVKAASTAAVATDPALVVAISPNNPISVGGVADATASGALGALNAAVQVSTAGLATVGFQLAAGTLVGTIVGEVSFDGGTTWNSTYLDTPASGKVSSIVFSSSNTSTAATIVGVGGSGLTRIRVSVYTSGTANVTLRATLRQDPSALFAGPPGAAVPPSVVLVGGSDGTNLTALRVKPASTTAVAADPALVVTASPNGLDVPTIYTSYQPDPSNLVGGASSVSLDASGRLEAHSTVLTDEGSFRDDFSGAALTTALTGTLTFTNGSTTVTGTGTLFTTQVGQLRYIKKTADNESRYVQVESIQSDTSLTLASAYVGTTATTTGVASNWQTITGTGGSIAVASSALSVGSGTTANAVTQVVRSGDYPPYIATIYASISQRIANQTAYFGFQAGPGASPSAQCTVQFSGTDNTKVTFLTAFSSQASDQTSTTVSLPNGGTTNTGHTYQISLSPNLASLVIDGTVVATSQIHLPAPYVNLSIAAGFVNGGSAPASNTTLALDMVYFANFDRLQVDDDFAGEPLPSQIVSLAPGISISGRLPVDTGSVDVFSQGITGQRLSQIQIPFNTETPATLLTVTTSGTATSALGTGVGTVSTGTGTTSAFKGVSPATVFYAPHHEVFSAWTVAFTTPTSAASFQRIGLYNTTDGFSLGYSGLTFGLWLRYNGADTFIAQTNWNIDTCSGNTSSKFTNQSLPAILDPTKINLFRVRFGWLGIAPVIFEILSPDGNFVIVHAQRFPNSQTTVSATNPNLPMTIEASKTASDATNLTLTTGCWVGGISMGATPHFSGINTIATNGALILLPTVGISALSWNITGTWVGTLTFQYSADGLNWVNDSVLNAGTGAFVNSTTTNQNFETNVAANKQYRIIATAWTSGAAIIAYNASSQTSLVLSQTYITDASSNGPAAVKAASTASAATDPSLVVALSPNSPVKSTVKPLYGTNNQAITITLASLASSATAARASTVVDNTTSLYEDALLFVKLTTAGAGTSATGYANIYVYATVDNGTTYSENATGSDAALTLVSPTNLTLVAQVNLVANAVTYRAGPFSVCRMAGWDRLPQKWGVVVANVSGATLNATAGNHAITYQGINGQLQ